MAADLVASEGRNADLVAEMTRLKGVVKEAKEEVKGDRAELAQCEKERADLRTSQGPIFRAFARGYS